MANKQTRRCISIKENSYQKLKEHCAKKGISMSGWLEAQTAKFFECQEDDLAVERKERKFEEVIFEVPGVKKEAAKLISSGPVRGSGTHLL